MLANKPGGLEAIKKIVEVMQSDQGQALRYSAAQAVAKKIQEFALNADPTLAHEGVAICLNLASTLLEDDDSREALQQLGEAVIAGKNREIFAATASLLANKKFKTWVSEDLGGFISDHKDALWQSSERGIKNEVYLRNVKSEDLTAIAETHASTFVKMGEAYGKKNYMGVLTTALGLFTTDATVRKVVGQVVSNMFNRMVEKAVGVFKGGEAEKGEEEQGKMVKLGEAAEVRVREKGRKEERDSKAEERVSSFEDQKKDNRSGSLSESDSPIR